MEIRSRLVGGLIVAVASAALFAGCTSAPQKTADVTPPPAAVTNSPQPADASSQSAALDAYVAAGQAQIQQLLDGSSDTYTDLVIEAVQPGTVKYTYTYTDAIDPALAEDSFEGMVTTLQTSLDTQVFPDMARAGITESQGVTFTYLNPDGSEVWSHTFSPTE